MAIHEKCMFVVEISTPQPKVRRNAVKMTSFVTITSKETAEGTVEQQAQARLAPRCIFRILLLRVDEGEWALKGFGASLK